MAASACPEPGEVAHLLQLRTAVPGGPARRQDLLERLARLPARWPWAVRLDYWQCPLDYSSRDARPAGYRLPRQEHPRKRAAAADGRGFREGPKPAADAPKKVEGSCSPARCNPFPYTPGRGSLPPVQRLGGMTDATAGVHRGARERGGLAACSAHTVPHSEWHKAINADLETVSLIGRMLLPLSPAQN
jgi:hypothetical protein